MAGTGRTWWKSTRSGDPSDNCVEVSGGGDEIQVRDSKDPAGHVLAFAADGWRAFISGVKAGEFDRSDGAGNSRGG